MQQCNVLPFILFENLKTWRPLNLNASKELDFEQYILGPFRATQ
jgi:hypothetical protein